MNAPGNARLRYLNSISIFHAASTGDLRRLRSMLQSNPRLVNTRSLNDGGTPLLAAAQSGRLEAVQCCLEYGADPEARNDRGLNALHLACRKGLHEVAADDAAQNEQPSGPGSPGSPTLDNQEARLNNSTVDEDGSVTRHLLRQLKHRSIRADVDARDADGRTALHHAALTGNVDAAQALLGEGADFFVRDTDDNDPLTLARTAGAHECASLLMTAEKVYLLHKARRLHETEEERKREGEKKRGRRTSSNNHPYVNETVALVVEEEGGVGEQGGLVGVIDFIVRELNADLFRELQDGLGLVPPSLERL